MDPKNAEAYSWFFVDKGYDEPDHLMGIADDSAWPPGIKAAHKAKIIEVANAMLETDPNGGAPDPLASMPADPAVAAERLERASKEYEEAQACLLYTSPSPRDGLLSRMPSSA